MSLFSSLLGLADRFEKFLDLEHVEDVLINKRVVVDDEWAQIHDLLDDDDQFTYMPRDVMFLQAYQSNEDRLPDVQRVLIKTSEINRLRQSYLCLRDWMKRRPW